MYRPAPGLRAFRQTAGAIGAVALISLGATPAMAEDSAPGLVLEETAPFEGVEPGSSIKVPASFTNTGTEALDKVYLAYSLSRGLDHQELPSNCVRYDIPSYDEAPEAIAAVCEFAQTIEPGVVYTPQKTLTVDVRDHALYDQVRVTVSTYDSGAGDSGAQPVPGTAPAIKLVERPDAPAAEPGSAEHEDWDAANVPVTAVNTADFKVTGAQLKGSVGETVDLAVKFTNAGPGWVNREPADEPGPTNQTLVRIPAGTKVTKTDGFCSKVSAGTYRCGTSQAWVDENEDYTYAFRLKIEKAVPGAKGSVELGGPARPFDTVKTNDKADITLDVAGTGSTGGGDSTTGGSGSTSTGGTGSTTGGSGGTGGSTGSTSTGGGSATTGSSTTGTTGTATGGDLADTGSGATLPLAGAAAAAVAVGAGAIVVVRRRRAVRD
ncbi:hypothetical protein ACWC10_32445 [Streptomyces sp. NPDC001595]|uniref:hypothetical protein n=1 Tax=Streptomyces sp. NPDC001532 TaxID=3154520 RepID=UPI003330AB82